MDSCILCTGMFDSFLSASPCPFSPSSVHPTPIHCPLFTLYPSSRLPLPVHNPASSPISPLPFRPGCYSAPPSFPFSLPFHSASLLVLAAPLAIPPSSQTLPLPLLSPPSPFMIPYRLLTISISKSPYLSIPHRLRIHSGTIQCDEILYAL